MYCRSNLGDKISDYEDLWTQENNSRSSLHISLDGNGNASKECEMKPPTAESTPVLFETKKSPFYSGMIDFNRIKNDSENF